jgi:hypothetical protein
MSFQWVHSGRVYIAVSPRQAAVDVLFTAICPTIMNRLTLDVVVGKTLSFIDEPQIGARASHDTRDCRDQRNSYVVA